MKRLFDRRPATVTLPDLASESWDGDDHVVVVHVSHDTLRPEDHETADRLTEAIVAVVNAIQAGVVGESIPEGTKNAGVRIQIEPSHRHLGPLEERTLEIFSERLGASIPISDIEGANPPEADDDPQEDPKLAKPEFVWDAAHSVLTTTVALPLTNPDARTARVARTFLDAALEGLANPENQALIPAEQADSAQFAITMVIHKRSVRGPATAAFVTRATERFAKTRVALTLQ